MLMTRALRAVLPLAGVAALLAGGCSDGDGPTGRTDIIPPDVTIEVPAEGQIVNTQPPFRIRVTDNESGIFCTTLRATIEGRDVSQFLRAGCNEETGLIQHQGQIILSEGGNRLQFTIGDNAGNETTETRNFTVAAVCEPPLCGGGGPP